MDIKISIKLSDDTAEISKTFASFQEAVQHLNWIKSVVAIAHTPERVHELMNF